MVSGVWHRVLNWLLLLLVWLGSLINMNWRRTKLCWSLWCHVWVWVSPEEDNLSAFHSKSLPFVKIKITKMQNRLQVAPKFSTCFWRPQTVPSTAQIEDGNMQGIVNSLSDNDTICFAGKINNISTADYYFFFKGIWMKPYHHSKSMA